MLHLYFKHLVLLILHATIQTDSSKAKKKYSIMLCHYLSVNFQDIIAAAINVFKTYLSFPVASFEVLLDMLVLFFACMKT